MVSFNQANSIPPAQREHELEFLAEAVDVGMPLSA